MKTQLIRLTNSGSSIVNNSTPDDSNDDSSNGIRRIVDDTTLQDLIRNDRSLVIFLMVLGFYIDDDRNSYAVKIVARIWQTSLLLFGGIGFCWDTFVYGGYYISQLYDLMTSSTSKSIGVFIYFGEVLANFIVPIVQIASLIYGIYNVNKHICQPVNGVIVSPLVASCKRSAVVYFICMALLVIAIDPIMMTHNYYEAQFIDYYDDGKLSQYGEQTYSLYVFNRFTARLFFNLSVACYLSVMLLFTSLTMMHINAIQEEVMKIVSTKSSCFLNKYLEAKRKIVSLKKGSYFSTQLLTFTAAINVISLMFRFWYFHYSYIKSSSSTDDDAYVIPLNYNNMIFSDFSQFPFLLKGNTNIYINISPLLLLLSSSLSLSLSLLLLLEVVFFFYILHRASVINTNHDKIVDIANDKYWEISNSNSSSSSSSSSVVDLKQLFDYTKIGSDTYAVFKLGPIEIRRGQVIATVVGFLSYCIYVLVVVRIRA